MKYDVCIIGGGAAGLMAAIFAAHFGWNPEQQQAWFAAYQKLLEMNDARTVTP
jgi:succinate dehydrogenase/fumarate reductase flavoprotein subunit